MAVSWLTAFLDSIVTDAAQSEPFWSALTGWPVSERRGDGGEFAKLQPEDGDAFLKLQVVGDAKPGQLHLDVHTDDRLALAAEVTRLRGEVVMPTGGYAVCRSPGGLTFCVVGHAATRRPMPVTWPAGRSIVDQVCLDIPGRRFEQEAEFWSALTGWPRRHGSLPEFDYLLRPPGMPLRILLQRLGPDEDGPVRGHLDFACDNVAMEVARHLAVGASLVREARHWTTLTDPVGRTYCVTSRRPETATPP